MHPPEWTFSPEALGRAVTPRTKGIMVCTPANPSGKVFTRAELEWIAAVAREHDLFVFTDEIYEYSVYVGRRHLSPGPLPELAERTITISGFSKCFSVPCWRIWYGVSDPRWARGRDRAMDLLARSGVAAVPGSAFFHGPKGDRLLRFCFAKSDAELEEACQRLERL